MDTLDLTEPPIDRARIQTILLATDLSSASTNAEELAFELAARLRGTLLLVSVVDPRGLWMPNGGYRQRMDQARGARQEAAQRIVDRARHEGVPVQILIWDGNPAEAIVDAAVAEGVDMIVVGSHQRRGVDRLVKGSVSEQVVRTSPVPVVVARRPLPVSRDPDRPTKTGRLAPPGPRRPRATLSAEPHREDG